MRQRTIDLGVTATALPCVAPVMVVIAAMIKVRSPGPVFFRQERLGRDGRTFRMFKFRTMYRDAPERLLAEPRLYESYLRNDFKLPLADDPRVVPGSAFLRRWSLDELPQLFDVLAGRMSLVGPAPDRARRDRTATAPTPGRTARSSQASPARGSRPAATTSATRNEPSSTSATCSPGRCGRTPGSC